jgi:hypothetical protein
MGVLPLQGIETPATGAMKRSVTSFGLKPGMITAIIIDPQAKEEPGHEQAIHQGDGDEIHAVGLNRFGTD